MDKEEIKSMITLNVHKLFQNGEMQGVHAEYSDAVNYSYVEANEKIYKLAGLLR